MSVSVTVSLSDVILIVFGLQCTCKGLTEACEVEESSFGHGEELAQKNQEGDGGEDHREDHEGLDGLQPV